MTAASSKPLRSSGGLPPTGVRVVAAYIRVSRAAQDYRYQRHAIEQAARARGVVIHRWYADVASGSTMARPQLRALRAAIRSGAVRQLWVWRLDRLTRSGIVDSVSALQEMDAAGCECISLCDPFPTSGPLRDIVVSVLAGGAQLALDTIRENVLAGRARARAEGRRWGRPPLSPELRQRARELRSGGASEREIARTLKTSKTWVHRVLTESEQKAAACF